MANDPRVSEEQRKERFKRKLLKFGAGRINDGCLTRLELQGALRGNDVKLEVRTTTVEGARPHLPSSRAHAHAALPPVPPCVGSQGWELEALLDSLELAALGGRPRDPAEPPPRIPVDYAVEYLCGSVRRTLPPHHHHGPSHVPTSITTPTSSHGLANAFLSCLCWPNVTDSVQ